MQKNQILISELTPEQLEALIGTSVEHQFSIFQKQQALFKANDELLSREEASKFLKIDLSTLYHWTNKGKIKAYAIGTRRYYKRTELLECLKPINTSSNE